MSELIYLKFKNTDQKQWNKYSVFFQKQAGKCKKKESMSGFAKALDKKNE